VVLGNQYKLVMGTKSTDLSAVELYDLTDDPAEEHNLAASHADVVRKMQAELRDWQTSVLTSLTGADY
jgi:hypothetical protein